MYPLVCVINAPLSSLPVHSSTCSHLSSLHATERRGPFFLILSHHSSQGFPGGASGKEAACQCRRRKRHRFHPWVGKIPWRSMAMHSSILACRIPWTEEPGELQPMGLQTGVAKCRTRLKRLSTHHSSSH